MHTLDELTRIITDSMNEMASGAVQINNAVQEVNTMTQKIEKVSQGSQTKWENLRSNRFFFFLDKKIIRFSTPKNGQGYSFLSENGVTFPLFFFLQ